MTTLPCVDHSRVSMCSLPDITLSIGIYHIPFWVSLSHAALLSLWVSALRLHVTRRNHGSHSLLLHVPLSSSSCRCSSPVSAKRASSQASLLRCLARQWGFRATPPHLPRSCCPPAQVATPTPYPLCLRRYWTRCWTGRRQLRAYL